MPKIFDFNRSVPKILGALIIGGALTIGGAFTASSITSSGAVEGATIHSVGAMTASSTLNVTGATTFGNTVNITGASTLSSLTVTNISALNGAVTLGSTLAAPAGLTTLSSLTATGTVLLGTSGSSVGVGTSTNLGADLHVYSGSSGVSSTLMVGSSANGAYAQSLSCYWNGTEFLIAYATSGAAGTSWTPGFNYTTNTSCVLP